MKENNPQKKLEAAVFGGGCFWCLEAVYNRVKGVKSVTSGYAGGKLISPTYEAVISGLTGHAETVKIVYDPDEILYETLLHIFFSIHDPMTPNRQGNDVGTQYRSIIFYANDEQQRIAQNVIKELIGQKLYEKPVVTEIVPLGDFYPAEEYHQKYFEKNPGKAYCQIVVAPKLAKFREKYGQYYMN